jgi:diacylglycerol kinase family enzyme
MKPNWFVIVNPTSGNGNGSRKIDKLRKLFLKYKLSVKMVISRYAKHEKKLCRDAISAGFFKIISVGGDGTLHHIVNGVMSQTKVESSNIIIGVIPIGTGNDWVKTYNISLNLEMAIKAIKSEKYIYQDIGKIKISQHSDHYYFNNIAGVGFDAYVVNKIKSLKQVGAMAYLIGGLLGFLNFKQSYLSIQQDNFKKKIQNIYDKYWIV